MAIEEVRQLYASCPIKLQTNETRLVSILPGKAGDEITCTLSVVAPGEEIPEALSYACGDPHQTSRITVDDVALQVTTNLVAALKRIRRADRSRQIWIDAISIDQTNKAERADQVARMNQIYGRALTVTVWLGFIDEAEMAITTLEALGTNIAIHWDAANTPSLVNLTDTSLKACTALLSSPWFSRVWTAQEAVLARDLHFLCGDFDLSGWKLLGAVDSFYRHGNDDCCAQFLTVMTERVPARAAFASLYDVIHYRRSDTEIDFAKLLFDFSHRHTWRKHDKVYGMLGLAQGKFSRLLHPDYDLGVVELYKQTAFQILKTSRSLDFWTLMTEKDPSLGYPSWIQNWNEQPTPRQRFLRDNRLRALRLTEPLIEAQDLEDLGLGGILKLRGKHVSFVTKVSKAAVPLMWTNSATIADVFKQWEDMLIQNRILYPTWTKGPGFEDVFAETIAAFSLRQKNDQDEIVFASATPYLFADCRPKWLDWLHAGRPTEPHVAPELVQYNNAVFTATADRRLVITARGDIMLAPARVSEGDEVVALSGGRCLYALRRTANCSSLGLTTYSLLGDCYVHGVAQIVLRDLKGRDLKGSDLQDFQIV